MLLRAQKKTKMPGKAGNFIEVTLSSFDGMWIEMWTYCDILVRS
jgi:hypothetical protein